MRVIGSPGKRPILRNVSRAEVDAFRKQVRVVDFIGCEDVDTIITKLKELAKESVTTCACTTCSKEPHASEKLAATIIQAKEPSAIKLGSEFRVARSNVVLVG